jgi:hypothetical protein
MAAPVAVAARSRDGRCGRSAALHSHDEEDILQMRLELPISRLVVNQASALTAEGR